MRRRPHNHSDRLWARKVKTRDGCCRVCKRDNTLEAHHLTPWANKPELRLDVDNGVALCHECHVDFHRKFGKGNKTNFLKFRAETRKLINQTL